MRIPLTLPMLLLSILALSTQGFSQDDASSLEAMEYQSISDSLRKDLASAGEWDRELNGTLTRIDNFLSRYPESGFRGEMVYLKGRVLQALDRHAEASNTFLEFTNDFPASEHAMEARINRIRSLTEGGYAAEALGEIELFLKNHGTRRIEYWLLKISALQDLERFDEAKSVVAEALEALQTAPRAGKIRARFQALQAIGNRFADFSAFDAIRKSPLNLDSLQGDVVLVYFWSSKSEEAVAKLQEITGMYGNLKELGFTALGINLDSDTSGARILLGDKNLDWPQIVDQRGSKSEFLSANGVPELPFAIVLDSRGRIRAMGLKGAALERAVRRLLTRKAATASKAAAENGGEAIGAGS